MNRARITFKDHLKPLALLLLMIIAFWYILGNHQLSGWPVFFLASMFLGFAHLFSVIADLKKENQQLKDQLKQP